MKRGLSTVVATLLFVLLVIVAVAIVWVVVKVFVDNSLDSASFGERTINLKIISVSFAENGLKVDIQRDAGEGTIVRLKFLVEGDGSIAVESDGGLNQFERDTFIIPYDKLEGINSNNIKKVSVAPIILTDAEKEKTGNILDVYVFGE